MTNLREPSPPHLARAPSFVPQSPTGAAPCRRSLSAIPVVTASRRSGWSIGSPRRARAKRSSTSTRSAGSRRGECWERRLHEASQRCEPVIFLVSRNWLASGWPTPWRNEQTLKPRYAIGAADPYRHARLPDRKRSDANTARPISNRSAKAMRRGPIRQRAKRAPP
jgi:hypothetical protein